MALNARVATQLKSLADSGDMMAKALVEGVLDCKFTVAAENTGANTILVTGQLVDGVGNVVSGVKNVLITSKPVSGAGTMTDGGAGAVVAGSASVSCWMTTDAAGKFQVTVLNAAAEVNLIMVQMDNGDVAQVVLTFV